MEKAQSLLHGKCDPVDPYHAQAFFLSPIDCTKIEPQLSPKRTRCHDELSRCSEIVPSLLHYTYLLCMKRLAMTRTQIRVLPGIDYYVRFHIILFFFPGTEHSSRTGPFQMIQALIDCTTDLDNWVFQKGMGK